MERSGMQFRYNIFFLTFISVATIHHIYSLGLDYVIVPKSIDYKDITWHGMLGKNKTKTFTAYVYRLEIASLSLLDREIDAVIVMRNKNVTNNQGEYRCEYWTKDGHALITSSNTGATNKESKKRYYLYRDAYKKIKDKKTHVGIKDLESSVSDKKVFYEVILTLLSYI